MIGKSSEINKKTAAEECLMMNEVYHRPFLNKPSNKLKI